MEQGVFLWKGELQFWGNPADKTCKTVKTPLGVVTGAFSGRLASEYRPGGRY